MAALVGVGIAAIYYFGRVRPGLTTRYSAFGWGYKLLENKYYLDHLYTRIIAGGMKGPVAKAAYRFNQEGIDKVVNVTAERAVQAGNFAYNIIDQKVVDGVVNSSGAAPHMAGEEARRMQTGKVQTYAGIVFVGAALLALVFIIFL